MRWTPGGSRANIEDRRGSGGGGFRMGGGGKMGLGGTVILLVLSLVFGRNLLDGGGGVPGDTTTQVAGGEVAVNESPEEAQRREFVTFVLNDAQETWAQLLPKYGSQYRDAKLVLFRDGVQSGCGAASSGVGPFYCPVDERAYIDLSFYDDLQRQFGASGDFAQAYVLAHEIGHHVQHVLGTDARVRQLQEARPRQANELSVRLELQADCYAGVWGNSTNQRRILESGDVEEGLRAAAAIGDDRIQKMTRGEVQPESFTHGSSAQRVAWFRRGLESGNPQNCDTFVGAI